MRATTSTPEPAGKPISTVIGLAGQSSARAEAAERKRANEASRTFNMRAFNMECLRRTGELAAMLRQ